MKITSVITTEIDLEEVYQHCTPISRKKCVEAIRGNVDFLIRMKASPEGGWSYPDAEVIAADLIERGFATTVN